jgi:hypothetical protein
LLVREVDHHSAEGWRSPTRVHIDGIRESLDDLKARTAEKERRP